MNTMSYNKNIYVLAMLCLLAFSCQKEVESITMETEFPQTVELIEASLVGEIVDIGGFPMEEALVEIMFDGEVLRSFTVAGGSFTEIDQTYHPTHTVIRVSADGFTPNFATPQVEAGQPMNISFTMDQHELLTTHVQGEVAEHYNVDNLLVYFQPETIGSDGAAFGIVSQTFDFGYETKDLMLANRSIDAAGNLVTLDFKEVFFIGAFNELGEELSVGTDQMFNATKISDVTDPSVFYFDQERGVWLNVSDVEATSSGFNITSDQLTVYGVISACADDTKSPTPYCFAGVEHTYVDGLEIRADLIDAGSFDDCDMDLTKLVRRIQDDCGYGDNEFRPFLSICSEDVGKNIEVELLLIDDARNSDYCLTNINIVAGSGNGDPVPVCISLSTALFTPGLLLWAQDFDFNSYDDSTAYEDLVFEIRKEVDVCGNGSDNFGTTIELCDAEKGETIDVILRVTDEDNNSSTCTVELRVI